MRARALNTGTDLRAISAVVSAKGTRRIRHGIIIFKWTSLRVSAKRRAMAIFSGGGVPGDLLPALTGDCWMCAFGRTGFGR